MVSALTPLGLDERMARYASDEDLAEVVRLRFDRPNETLRELFGRLVFHVLCGNTDDHARNHAAFWDGARLSLTPAYDLCPQNRTGNVAGQAMRITGRTTEASCSSACRRRPCIRCRRATPRTWSSRKSRPSARASTPSAKTLA